MYKTVSTELSDDDDEINVWMVVTITVLYIR